MTTDGDAEREDIWRWIWDDGDELEPSPERSGAAVLVAVPDAEAEAAAAEPTPQPQPLADPRRPVTVVPPVRARRSARKRVRKRLLVIGALAVVAGAAAAVATRLATREAPEQRVAPPPATAAVADQRVVAFAVWDEGAGSGYLAVLAAGGGKEPVAVAFPDAAAVTIPGHDEDGTVADATSSGDVTVVQATAENVLGIRVDDAIGVPLEELAPLVDALGLLDLSGELASGDDVVRYLSHERGRPAPERLARWQEVLSSLLAAARGRPDDLEAIPERLRAVFAAGAEVVSLPTEEIGAGLVKPDEDEISELVSERFVPTAAPATSGVRLVVLNGNGTPGVGEDVARLLVPEGFRLVANENWERFDLEKTQIVASSPEYLNEARLARRLLGVGEVFLDATQSGFTDVTVVVGDDFGRP